MSKIDSNDLIDIFKEEITKKNKKEIKKQKKKEKKLEKQENIEFEKLAKKAEEIEKKQEVKKVEIEPKKKKNKDKNESVFLFLYDTIFGFFLILLLFVTIGFIGITIYKNNSFKTIIQLSLIGVFAIFYILSMVCKKEGIKKFASIIANAAICTEMILILYFA